MARSERRLPWRDRAALYNTRRWRALRRAIFDRDGWRCVGCKLPGALECDHISRDPDLFWEPSNLRTLCRSCHIERHRRDRANSEHRKRQRRWAAFAKELA